ncbi:probable adenylate kinase [Natronomonas pharaonis DSM 2160]|uniref:Putative adenylate kinase n=1 Tax=Natronomonas pharaonis (strain ATCC 35678 / DSM 2160 / CIP 103997 / JCM 8858 / NBRC 14720 / NCIMB 2260 / Gabara) TaxID=348780 RepID=KAD6_NATPD|nr:AAA family ATPase [Natronomonas pharaonis]Q3IRT0.1 RecName: Full=Putative adenylate kinase; Short=AK; AltName: Full=ATP-AMP transphosphorylase [Natronomonas pharaonis DSM 2160]CAI49162.1 probable adenylate kinase [Natronomonas pharaonis DSM 2160]
MRVAVTGTPGTGKTTATEAVETALDVIHLNERIREEGLDAGRDEERDSLVADLDAVEAALAGEDDALIESHLAHHVDADRVVVLRCRPDILQERLVDRGEPAAKAAENAEAEALDVVLSEAVAEHGRESVYEIDTTEASPSAVAEAIEAVIDGERAPAVGTVDFTEHL